MPQISSQPYPYYDIQDRLAEVPISIDYEHHMVHREKTFSVSYTSTSVASNGYLDIRVTGVTNDAHLKINYTTEGKARLKTYVGTTYTVDGTSYTPFNRCICSTNVATTLIRINPTINVLGTIRADEFVGSAAASNRAGGVGGGSIESIVNPGYDLLIRLQNVAATAADLCLVLNFYELPPSTT